MAALSFTACNKDDEDIAPVPVPVPEKVKPCCLIFYSANGDQEHDANFSTAIPDLVNCIKGTTCAVAYMSKPAQGCGDTVYRYTAANGEAKKDSSWQKPTKGFPITDPATLTEFIKWSAEQFPDYRYILVISGHGMSWTQYDARETVKSRATLCEDDNCMKAYQLADAVKASEVKIDAFFFDSCFQGSIEFLTEWKDVTDYVLCYTSAMPDAGSNLGILAEMLNGIKSNEKNELSNALATYLKSVGKYNNIDEAPVSMSLIETSKIDAVNKALRETFAYMKSSLDKTSISTDSPAKFGETFRSAFQRAISKTYKYEFTDGVTADLEQMLHDCTMYSADAVLMRHTENVCNALNDAIVYRYTTDKTPFAYHSWSIFGGIEYFSHETIRDAYRSNLFNTATGYLDLMEELAKK